MATATAASVGTIWVQIIGIDVICSIVSILTAAGMTDDIPIIGRRWSSSSA